MASPESFASLRVDDDGDIDEDRAHKRPRLSREPSDDGYESEEPVLPDSFRRSPQTQRPEFQPGSIVRITLNNFVTYTNAQFFPGPNLNMVIGPNGTGKSTLVCAICLGLGWGTQHLGRAKNISEFIKHGSKTAQIEIELAMDPARQSQNAVITTKITNSKSASGKTEFFINHKEASKQAVQKLAKSYSIQVDNLCQFLPQDRVVEFAGLSPVQLLMATQRAAAASEVCDWHEELISRGKDVDNKQNDRSALDESIKRLEARQRAQQVDVERIREFASWQQKKKYLELAKPFPEYREAHAEFRESKERRDASNRELTILQQQLEPNLRAVNEKAEYLTNIEAAKDAKKRLVDRTGSMAASKNNEYEAKGREITQHQNARKLEVDSLKRAQAQVNQLNTNIAKLEADLKQAPPAVDFAQMNSDVRDFVREGRSLDEAKDKVTDSLQTLQHQGEQRMKAIQAKENQKTHLQSQLGRQASQLGRISKDAAKALTWLQNNKSLFTGPVYEPPLLSCSVKDTRCIPMLEAALKRVGATMFSATTDEDFKVLQEHLYDASKLNLSDISIRQTPSRVNNARPCSPDELNQLGLEGYLIDLLEGPEEVLATLCDNHGLDVTAYTTRDLSNQQLDRIKDSPISAWMTLKEHSSILRRREYGAGAVSTRVDQLRPPAMFTDSPVNTDAERDLDRAIRELKDEIGTIKQECAEVRAKLAEIDEQRRIIKQAINDKNHEKETLQRARASYDAIPTKLESLRSERAQEQRKIDSREDSRAQHEATLDNMYLDKAQLAIAHSKQAEAFHNLHMELIVIELMEIEAKSDHQQLAERSAEDQRLLQHHQAEVQKLATVVAELKQKARDLSARCRQASDEIPAEDEIEFNEMCNLSSNQLNEEISSASARLEMNGGGNANVIKEFENRAKEIEKKQAQLQKFDETIENATTQIALIRAKWEPVLEEIVSKISERFSENFASIQCAGEVELYKSDTDYSQWAIHIKVKFRENEPMSVLNNQRQSGGERAVSTIFYLMAMQSLARAPFRVVDEINQGMDPRNERMVHSRLVSIACDSARNDGTGGSQYFLITPKLLTGLEHHPNMKVHCIASGEYMPKGRSLDSLDFGKLAQKALAVRAARG